ncbi:S1C family serine protease [Hydrogenophaga sp.]|uniref:S1C family serine protease n=1 Tax=Hydrogenophaga sp. TaxID=1904254 RepID=UPI0035AF37F5
MRKTPLYSPSARAGPAPVAPSADDGVQQTRSPAGVGATASRRSRIGAVARDPRGLWLAWLVLAGQLGMVWWWQAAHPPRVLTQKDIDAAVLRTLTTQSLPSRAARAAEKIRPSVVRVIAYVKDGKGRDVEHGIGTGVVIQDQGVVLTNLHVVHSAQSLRLVFADGSESEASVTAAQPQHDLAVLQAHKVPDDLRAATLRTTAGLLPGDEVVVVGFPFGIGPSTSAGVVSGLGRSFKSPEGQQEIDNLIQFDAAANPGNSGGPLATMDGEVVGVVTGILNPTRARTFLGIGFAVPIESAAAAAGLPPF